MSALNKHEALAAEIAYDLDFPAIDLSLIQAFVGRFFWAWYHLHEDDVIVRVGKWFISFNVRVRDLRSLFELLFGGDPHGPIQ